jgi:hypothetical protein
MRKAVRSSSPDAARGSGRAREVAHLGGRRAPQGAAMPGAGPPRTPRVASFGAGKRPVVRLQPGGGPGMRALAPPRSGKRTMRAG